MPNVIYIAQDGLEYVAEAPAGESLMKAAVTNGVPGILADCGGACTCATCHVYVDEAWQERLPTPDEMESAMLEFVEAEVRPTSRLSCQITLTDELDGLVVRVP